MTYDASLQIKALAFVLVAALFATATVKTIAYMINEGFFFDIAYLNYIYLFLPLLTLVIMMTLGSLRIALRILCTKVKWLRPPDVAFGARRLFLSLLLDVISYSLFSSWVVLTYLLFRLIMEWGEYQYMFIILMMMIFSLGVGILCMKAAKKVKRKAFSMEKVELIGEMV